MRGQDPERREEPSSAGFSLKVLANFLRCSGSEVKRLNGKSVKSRTKFSAVS